MLAKSISEVLIQADGDFGDLLSATESKAESIRDTTAPTSYRYPSQEQARSAYIHTTGLGEQILGDDQYLSEHYGDLAVAIRLHLFDLGSDTQLLGVAIWVKQAVIGSLLKDIVALSSGTNPVLFLIAIRSIFENIGQVLLLHQDLEQVLDSNPSTKRLIWEAVVKCGEVVQERCKGTRIDWEDYFQKSLTEGEKKSYKPREAEVDATAKSIMYGIDALEKSIKGVRKAYELLSEFAHPNLGVHNLLISSASQKTLRDGIRLWNRKYCVDSYTAGIDQFSPQFKEVLQLLLSSVDRFEHLNRDLRGYHYRFSVLAKKSIKLGMNNHPFIFDLQEPCPCFSGRKVGACCGTKIRKIHKTHGSA